MDASVIIACRDGGRHLRETLEAVTAQRWDRPWEIVLADNGSTDDSVDSDDVPAPGWLRAMGEALRDHDLVAARAELGRLSHGPLGVYRSIPGDGVYRLPFPPYCESMAGALMGFTKRLHAAVGGFNPDIPIEDDEFCIRAHLAGFRIARVPAAVVHYRLRQELPAVFAQSRRYAELDVALAKAYRHTAPGQVGAWGGLYRKARRAAGRYWRLRLQGRSRDIGEEARLQLELGSLAGQIVGVVKYGARPTVGRPPAPWIAREVGTESVGEAG